MIKLGTYILGDSELSHDEKLKMTKAAGFDRIALGMSLFASDELEPVVDLCAKHGLEIDNIHLTGAKTTAMWLDDDELAERVLARYCREIERASAAGIKIGVAHITWGHTLPGEMTEKAFSRYDRLAECAKKNGFVVSLENSVYIDYLYATMKRLKDYDSIGYTYDSGHRNAFAPECDLLADFGDRLTVTHIQDNNGIHDLHMMPFDGNADWQKVAKGLAKTKVGRDHICAEVASGSFKELKGMTEEEARASVLALPIAHHAELISFDGNKVAVGNKLSYEEKLERLYFKMKKLAEMIEAES